MKIKIRARTMVAGIAAVSVALLLTGASAGAANGGATVSGSVVGELVGAALVMFPAFAGLPDSLGSDAPVILHGRLTDPSGAAMAGARVLLSAWPSNDVIHDLPIGGTFALTPVARTAAGPDGRYELRSLVTPLLASLTSRDVLDVELDVFHGGRHYLYRSAVRPEGTGGGWVPASLEESHAAEPSVRAGSGNTLDVAFDRGLGSEVGRDLLRFAASTPSDPDPPRKPQPPACSPFQKIGEEKTPTTVATAVVRNGVKVLTEYGTEAVSELSTGFSAGGGVFTVSGSTPRTSRRGATWKDKSKPGATNTFAYQARWLHTITERLCPTDMTGKHFKAAWQTTPDRSTGGAIRIPNPAQYPAWTCTKDNSEPALATTVYTENEKARNYVKDWFLPVMPGGAFVGNARSGYSEDVKITFEFPNQERGYWCGDSGDPGTDGQRLQASQVAKGQRVPGAN